MMHEGHLKLFERMSAYGSVIVGVLDNETVMSYKRAPVMSSDERYRVVKTAKFVDEIIERCPLYTTEDFMKKHKIDIVGIGEEYYFPPYKYYEDCVRLNKFVIIPRYQGISTSTLIKRIRSRDDLDVNLQKKEKKKREKEKLNILDQLYFFIYHRIIYGYTITKRLYVRKNNLPNNVCTGWNIHTYCTILFINDKEGSINGW